MGQGRGPLGPGPGQARKSARAMPPASALLGAGPQPNGSWRTLWPCPMSCGLVLRPVALSYVLSPCPMSHGPSGITVTAVIVPRMSNVTETSIVLIVRRDSPRCGAPFLGCEKHAWNLHFIDPFIGCIGSLVETFIGSGICVCSGIVRGLVPTLHP